MRISTRRLCASLLLAFLALSLADLYCTWRLFEQEGTSAAERNPLAQWILHNHGWTGVTYFKLWTVCVVGMVIAAVARHRPHTAMRLLAGACLLLFGVIFYSSSLLFFPGIVSADSLAIESELTGKNQALDEAMAELRMRTALKLQLAHDVVERRRSFKDAVATLMQFDRPDSARMAHLRGLYPGCSDQQCVAINVMEYILTLQRTDPKRMANLVRELAQAYEASYGTSVPACWWSVGDRIIWHFLSALRSAESDRLPRDSTGDAQRWDVAALK